MRKLRKIALPLAVFALGIGSAYATTASVKSGSTVELGYRFDPLAPAEKCQMTEQECSTIPSGDVCTYTDVSGEHNLFEQGCVNTLYKIQ
ncbi:hypothetical protein ASG01_13675 [Chryseobacterium sp. Leaf180]|uniref:DUF6520 family protein n=1 Tax=Chryseobacterium sp. Leaf180 TaxID=1736289 RepID=UPI0006F540C9|nr:DUF6520 family protein [Chryseobacterium sp. Leaf180]KQR91419.1 hypothetical protein ASG01_13675 [Chryseobacterium sp. Leaf180]